MLSLWSPRVRLGGARDRRAVGGGQQRPVTLGQIASVLVFRWVPRGLAGEGGLYAYDCSVGGRWVYVTERGRLVAESVPRKELLEHPILAQAKFTRGFRAAKDSGWNGFDRLISDDRERDIS